MKIVYLDNAATSHPKPECVYRAAERCMRYECGNPGRGAHPLSLAAANGIYSCREKICMLFGASSGEDVAFFSSDTAALNAIIKCTLKSGDNLLISEAEHNSVRRPALSLKRCGVDVRTYRAFCSEDETMSDIASKVDCRTKMICAVHQSNICPLTLPVKKIGEFCRRRGILFLVDIAQSAGHTEVDMRSLCADALCAPGHKGLFGLQGTGFAVLSENMKKALLSAPTLIEGGSGINSRDEAMPSVFPERLEAGTLNTPGIFALGAGIDYINNVGIGAIEAHERELFLLARDMLLNSRGIKLYMSEYKSGSILLFNKVKRDCEEVAAALADEGICVRAGLHCAPTAHDALGSGGAVRVSVGAFNTKRDIERFALALAKI